MWNRDCVYIFERYSNNILLESKQSIINLGYPRIIVDLLFEKYGKNSFIISKWLKETSGYKVEDKSDKDWWIIANRELSLSNNKQLDLVDLVQLYDAAMRGEQEYIKMREEVELPISPESLQNLDLEYDIKYLHKEIKQKLFNNYLFRTSIVKGLDSGKIKNIKEYSGLSFNVANEKYNKKRVFEESTPLKTYSNGYKWINVGEKCELIGGLMKNCGSTGVMSMDKDRTMLVLFDDNNVPHVVLTYSPNEKRISGIEGQASTASKEEYHDYVLDIAKQLEADIDYERESSKSKMLAIRIMLKEKLKNIKKIYSGEWDEYFLVKMNDDNEYYTNYHNYIPADEISSNNTEDIKNELKNIFTQAYRGNKTPAINKSDFLSRYSISMYSPKY